MTENTPPTFHALSRSERDHLLAAARRDGANGQDIQREVEAIRESDRPGNTTTYTVLDTLVEWGWLTKAFINGKATGYRVTDDGREVLTRARAVFDVSAETTD